MPSWLSRSHLCTQNATNATGQLRWHEWAELARRLVDPYPLSRGSRRPVCHNSSMDAAGALALRKYIEAHNGGRLTDAPEKARPFEPSAFPHIDAYLQAFYDSAEEVTPQ
jgi:hypothetical protein